MSGSEQVPPSQDRAAATAAAQAVEAYERAWRHGSFEGVAALVTDRLARELGIASRADFLQAAEDFAEASEGLSAQVTGIDVHGDAATVVTTETSLEGGDHVVQKVVHALVREDGRWRIGAIEAFDG